MNPDTQGTTNKINIFPPPPPPFSDTGVTRFLVRLRMMMCHSYMAVGLERFKTAPILVPLN